MQLDRSRRAFLSGGAAIGVSALAGCSDSTTDTQTAGIDGTIAGGATVPMYVHNPARTGALPDRSGPTDSVTAEWRFDDTDGYVQRSPTVVDDTVYVGCTDNYLYALDAAEGTEQWTFEAGGGIATSPAVVDGTVYVGSTAGAVYAISADDGSVEWATVAGEPVLSSPAVVDGTVYVGSGNRPDSGHVFGIDAETGDQQWVFDAGTQVRSSPAVTDGTVFVGCHDNAVYALDAASGGLSRRGPKSSRHRPFTMGRCTSGGTTTASTHSLSPPVRTSGRSRQTDRWSRHRRSLLTPSTSVAPTRTCTR